MNADTSRVAVTQQVTMLEVTDRVCARREAHVKLLADGTRLSQVPALAADGAPREAIQTRLHSPLRQRAPAHESQLVFLKNNKNE